MAKLFNLRKVILVHNVTEQGVRISVEDTRYGKLCKVIDKFLGEF